jgi:hypothetical protein
MASARRLFFSFGLAWCAVLLLLNPRRSSACILFQLLFFLLPEGKKQK